MNYNFTFKNLYKLLNHNKNIIILFIILLIINYNYLPDKIKIICDFSLFKLLFLLLIFYISYFNFDIAIFISILYLYIYINNFKKYTYLGGLKQKNSDNYYIHYNNVGYFYK